ncbi:MAG TPA: hypothetical protein VHA30_02430 [Patescibacteria group bacterium]|nr:hypothetical protein [Patescibacteria group bacterium]
MQLYNKDDKHPIEKLSVQVTLQRIIKQVKFVSVEVQEDDWITEADGSGHLDGKKILEKGVELGKNDQEGWEDESVEVILNPIQRPAPLKDGDKMVPLDIRFKK